jgi:hypothetical protein
MHYRIMRRDWLAVCENNNEDWRHKLSWLVHNLTFRYQSSVHQTQRRNLGISVKSQEEFKEDGGEKYINAPAGNQTSLHPYSVTSPTASPQRPMVQNSFRAYF